MKGVFIMGAGDIMNAGRQLFERINTVKAEKGQAEKLDANEIAQAKAFGFDSLFKLTNNMTEEEFVAQYSDVKFNNQAEEDAFMQKERDIHVKYIQLKYGIETEIQPFETIEKFEARARQEGLDKAIDNEVEKVVKEFGLDKEPETNEEYVKPDPTMSRDSKTHDW